MQIWLTILLSKFSVSKFALIVWNHSQNLEKIGATIFIYRDIKKWNFGVYTRFLYQKFKLKC